ncbi:MAG: NfeD family protein [Methylocystaceae bacterium]
MSFTIWFGIAVACAVIEMATTGFWFLWLALGAAVIALLAKINLVTQLPVQLVIFSLISLLLIIFTRPLLVRALGTRDTKSNVDALIGRQGVVIEAINPLTGEGQVKLDGEIWSVRAANPLAVGTLVVVEAVQGVRLLVRENIL